jgi:hypothetical protein
MCPNPAHIIQSTKLSTNGKMTTKELIESFLQYEVYVKNRRIFIPHGEDIIDMFLKTYHKDYFEVEHIKKEGEYEE